MQLLCPNRTITPISLEKELVSSLDIPNVGIKGYEEDDCIGTIVDELSKDTNFFIMQSNVYSEQ